MALQAFLIDHHQFFNTNPFVPLSPTVYSHTSDAVPKETVEKANKGIANRSLSSDK